MNRQQIIQYLLNTSSNKYYLEIGVSTGENFASIDASYKVGVDPIPPSDLVRSILNERCIYHSVTSDVFFSNEQSKNIHYDVVFVGGLHEYEQAYRDVVNALDILAPNGVIVLHDCQPNTLIASLPPQIFTLISEEAKKGDYSWMGDTWKALVRLRTFHPDLLVITLNCDCGCGIITRGKPESMLEYSIDQIKAFQFDDLERDKNSLLNLKEPGYLFRFLTDFRITTGSIRSKLFVNRPEEWMDSIIKDYHIKEKESSKTITNGIILPLKSSSKTVCGVGGVCDEQGNFIAGHTSNIFDPTSGLSVYEAYAVPEGINTLDETVVYGGLIYDHFGHFITECFSRLWYFVENSELNYKYVFVMPEHQVKLPVFIEYFYMLGIKPDQMVIIKEAVRYTRIIIPDQSIHIYSGYKNNAMKVYNKIRDSVTPAMACSKIYLSRTKLSINDTINEEYFENAYRALGYTVVYPEKLPLSEQVAMMAGAEEVAAVSGSLHHHILFCQDKVKITVLNRSHHENIPIHWINQARSAVCCFVDIYNNFLPTGPYASCYLLEPTDQWKSYIESIGGVYNELSESDKNNHIVKYLKRWAEMIIYVIHDTTLMSYYASCTLSDIVENIYKCIIGDTLDATMVKRLNDWFGSKS